MRLLNSLWKKGLAVFRALFGERPNSEQKSRMVLVQRGRALSRRRKRAVGLRVEKPGYRLEQKKVGMVKGLERASNAHLVLAEAGGFLSSKRKQEAFVAVAIGTVGKRLVKERNVGEMSSVKPDKDVEEIEESWSQAVKGKERFREIVQERGRANEASKFDNPKLKEKISKIKGALSEVSDQFRSSEEQERASEADPKELNEALNERHGQLTEIAEVVEVAEVTEVAEAERARASEAGREADRKGMYEEIAKINADRKAMNEEIDEMNRRARASAAEREAMNEEIAEIKRQIEVSQKNIDTQIARILERFDRLESKKNKSHLDLPISYAHSSLSMKKN